MCVFWRTRLTDSTDLRGSTCFPIRHGETSEQVNPHLRNARGGGEASNTTRETSESTSTSASTYENNTTSERPWGRRGLQHTWAPAPCRPAFTAPTSCVFDRRSNFSASTFFRNNCGCIERLCCVEEGGCVIAIKLI